MIKKRGKKPRNGQWSQRVAVYMSTDLYFKLEKKAVRSGMRESAYMRHLLVKELEKDNE